MPDPEVLIILLSKKMISAKSRRPMVKEWWEISLAQAVLVVLMEVRFV